MTDSAQPTPDPAAEVIAYLRAHEAPCPTCGYNLHHLTTPRCPECGSGIRLTIGATEPRLAAWLTLTIPLLLLAGCGVMFLLFTLVDPPPARYWPPVIVTWCAIPLAALAVWKRRVFNKLPSATRWLLAGLSCIGTLITFIWLLAIVR
jgi:hypothetical protein